MRSTTYTNAKRFFQQNTLSASTKKHHSKFSRERQFQTNKLIVKLSNLAQQPKSIFDSRIISKNNEIWSKKFRKLRKGMLQEPKKEM